MAPIHGIMQGREELYHEIDGNAPEMGRNIIQDVLYQNVVPAQENRVHLQLKD